MSLTKTEKRDLTQAGYDEGLESAKYAEITDMEFSEVGVVGENEDDLQNLSYDDAISVVSYAAWESEQNSRQYAGHVTYDITRTYYGAHGRDEWDLDEAYELYEAGVDKGIERGAEKRLGPKSKWKQKRGRLDGALGEIRRYGPGKFDTLLDSYLWDATLDSGADEETGYPDGGGWFGKLRFDAGMLASVQNAAADNNDKLTDNEAHEIKKNYGVILFERSDGIVEVAWYAKQAKLEADWNKIVEDTAGVE
jgi:hypothetical protein